MRILLFILRFFSSQECNLNPFRLNYWFFTLVFKLIWLGSKNGEKVWNCGRRLNSVTSLMTCHKYTVIFFKIVVFWLEYSPSYLFLWILLSTVPNIFVSCKYGIFDGPSLAVCVGYIEGARRKESKKKVRRHKKTGTVIALTGKMRPY